MRWEHRLPVHGQPGILWHCIWLSFHFQRVSFYYGDKWNYMPTLVSLISYQVRGQLQETCTELIAGMFSPIWFHSPELIWTGTLVWHFLSPFLTNCKLTHHFNLIPILLILILFLIKAWVVCGTNTLIMLMKTFFESRWKLGAPVTHAVDAFVIHCWKNIFSSLCLPPLQERSHTDCFYMKLIALGNSINTLTFTNQNMSSPRSFRCLPEKVWSEKKCNYSLSFLQGCPEFILPVDACPPRS